MFKINKSLLRNNLNEIKYKLHRYLSSNPIILGIETSCDDTGCAIVDSNGNILGDALNSQHSTHINYGGIIPPIAAELHRKNIENVVNDALGQAKLDFSDLDAIAVNTEPGLPRSLEVGTKYGRFLCRKYKKKFIPIHHMKAHSLTCRLQDKTIEFPFLVLLISGGHCLLALSQNADDFLLLGESIDDAPGEAFDKMARRMKLRNLPEYYNVTSGGRIIELAAMKATNPLRFKFSIPLVMYRHCNFSLSGIKNQVHRHIEKEEQLHDIAADALIPNVYDLCAGFQLTVTRHLCHRVQRAMEFLVKNQLVPESNKTLVVSGGVACNNFIGNALQIVCDGLEWRFVRTAPKLCMDNGIMIAWNGIERWRMNSGLTTDYNSIEVNGTSPIGKNITKEVEAQQIKCKWVRLSELNKAHDKEMEIF